MGTFESFEQIEAWEGARALAGEVYQLTQHDVFRKEFALVDQLRRSVISVMANIAEGFERSGTREFIQFLSQAKGSAGEVQSHLYLVLEESNVNRPSTRVSDSVSSKQRF
jgi:four helix bundle protein